MSKRPASCSLPIAANLAMLIHDRGASPDEAREYSATWSLQPDDRIAKTDRLAGAQSRRRRTSTRYWQGRELVGAHVAGDSERFRALLTARVLPRELAG